MPTTTSSTTLLESVNIVLANLGESPVNSLTGGALPQQVSLALNTIEEVSTDIQSKGWWFNQQSGGNYDTTANVVIYPSNTGMDWGADIPEEARRYITIRASRIAQTRLIGSEELQKFSYNEELVSLAILQQAHVRNSNGVLDFNAFPAELRSLGMDEVMFLQGNVEEKIGTLRLGGELANIAKTKAETDLIADQEALVTQQALTEVQETTKRTREAELIDAQEALLQKQILTEAEQVAKVQEEVDLLQTQDTLVTNQAATELKKALDLIAETTLKGKQGSFIDKQALTEVQNALKIIAETSLIGDQEALVVKQALTEVARATDLGADTTIKGKQGTLLDNQAATELKRALDLVADTSLKGKQGSLVDNQAATELKRALDLVADTTIKGKQGTLLDNQAATELKNALKLVAETSLINDQEALVVNQALTELARATDLGADTTLKGKQGTLLDNQAATELKSALKLVADTTLVGKQGSLVDTQALDVAADTVLKGKQGSLVDAQATDVGADTTLKGIQGTLLGAQTTDVAADTTLKGKQGALVDSQELKTDAERELMESQKTQLDAQTAIEVTAEKAFYDGVVAGTQNTYRDFAAEMRMMGIQETSFQSSPAYKKVELLKDAEKLRLVTATESGVDVTELAEVNRIMRLIGEPPVLALNDHSLASECVRLLRDTNMELQGRGWWFNTSKDEDDQDVIAQKVLSECPRKYLEYLEVRVAILLTELYPQSGIDIQRLPKMEVELRAYFKDREFDDANYSIFDSYDVASRVGRNRNYSVI